MRRAGLPRPRLTQQPDSSLSARGRQEGPSALPPLWKVLEEVAVRKGSSQELLTSPLLVQQAGAH